MKYNIQVPDPVQYILDQLDLWGYESYIVGGCVRDSILGRHPHDYDICTSATPEQIVAVFYDEEVIPTGLQHGTVTVVLDRQPYEITTYRIDGKYSDNRRPDSVEFTDNLIEDLNRRDFTINAMAYNPKTGLVDPFHGLNDISLKMIRCVGTAKDRFEEDALRILRAIRFMAQLNFSIFPEVDHEIHRQFRSLENISTERIYSEFCKIAVSDGFCAALVLYEDVFSLILPEMKDMIGFCQNNPYHDYDVFGHTIYALRSCSSNDLTVRLAVLFHDFGKPHSYQDGKDGIRHFKEHAKVSAEMTDKIMKRLKFDNETRNNVVQLVYYHDATFEIGEKYVKRWLNKIGVVQFKRLLEVRKADIKGQKQNYGKDRVEKVEKIEQILEKVLSEKSCFNLKDLAINGNDVKNTMRIQEGKDIGYWLNIILDRVISGELINNRDELIYWMTGIADGWIKY